MTPENTSMLSDTIEQAWSFAKAGKFPVAVRYFATARSMVPALADQKKLHRILSRDALYNRRKRDQQRKTIRKAFTGQKKLVIFSDSLGLPQLDEKSDRNFESPNTFSYLLGESLDDTAVDSLCQRFATTNNVLRLLKDEPKLGAASDVVIHIGLNDCANRMFLNRERLAMELLPDDIGTRIVEFARKYRRQILKLLPPYHYVDPDQFRINLENAVTQLRQRGVGKVILTTIILPPAKFWDATPGMNRNFGQYNQIIMNVCASHNAVLFDFDRLVWSNLDKEPLLPDGMHLSHAGHQIFAEECKKILG